MSYTDAVLKYAIEYASRPLPPTPKNMTYIDVIDLIDKFKHPSLPIISRFRFLDFFRHLPLKNYVPSSVPSSNVKPLLRIKNICT